MHAITINELQEWLAYMAEGQSPAEQDMARYFQREEEQQMRAMTATQRLAYLVHIGELAKFCPACGTRYVEVDMWELPGMDGGSDGGVTFECCGHAYSYDSQNFPEGALA
jgi:hypothetical protein